MFLQYTDQSQFSILMFTNGSILLMNGSILLMNGRTFILQKV